MTYIYYTYKINEPEKAYIGMTKNPIENGYLGSGKYINCAINKYGREFFKRTNLGEFRYREDKFWEKFYIPLYKTEVKYGGYNLSPIGGMGGLGCHSEETIKKLSDAASGKKYSNEVNKKKGRFGEENAFYGRQHSKESIEKMCESHKDFNHTKEAKKKISITMIEKNKESITCPHCRKVGRGNVMKRFHFDKCKNK